jgi:hypothetical protein
MWAGMTDQCLTNASPFASSSMKTTTFSPIMDAVTVGNCDGRRVSSPMGIIIFVSLARLLAPRMRLF